MPKSGLGNRGFGEGIGGIIRQRELRFLLSKESNLRVSPSEALVEGKYDNGLLVLLLSHKLGAVKVEIK